MPNRALSEIWIVTREVTEAMGLRPDRDTVYAGLPHEVREQLQRLPQEEIDEITAPEPRQAPEEQEM